MALIYHTTLTLVLTLVGSRDDILGGHLANAHTAPVVHYQVARRVRSVYGDHVNSNLMWGWGN